MNKSHRLVALMLLYTNTAIAVEREYELENEIEYEQEAEFDTTFVFGSSNGVDLNEVLKPLTGIYEVKLNGESFGNYYLVELNGK